MSSKKTPETTPPKKRGKMKMLLIGGGAFVLLGGGAGAGVYASRLMSPAGPAEDPNRPKLVVRGDVPEASSEGEGGESKEPAPKIGTVSVTSDNVPVDPRKYDVTYVPLEQPFTANLANGGIIQVGLSFATYYDHRVVENLKRQTVAIRSAALMVLAEQDPNVLATGRGKQALQRELTQSTNKVLRDKEGFGGIDNVYFTSLVIQ
ncbi:flagellar basal body-associated FliL family protein [Sphingomonas ginkgonis]|uniref:Flagellar protein FliL n=1 Tax=Sphingomonas ginkgonis TaxID=2315330 RepID=A0A429VC84_9SPHN|nr:flagellar basal body-associated FliL family protein [Sphingomonas ginkgonis]RST31564.1 flagellar basal body-associated FliL family protein [Sphingomonas ginkgonis]